MIIDSALDIYPGWERQRSGVCGCWFMYFTWILRLGAYERDWAKDRQPSSLLASLLFVVY
jgi:hypothetical protein